MEDKKGKRCLNNMNFVLMQILSMIMTVVMIRIRYSSALPSMKRVPQYRAILTIITTITTIITIFTIIITISIQRYSSALPSMKRVPQYRADIIAVLLGSFEVFIDQHYNGWYMQQHHRVQNTILIISWFSPVSTLFMNSCTRWQRTRYLYLCIRIAPMAYKVLHIFSMLDDCWKVGVPANWSATQQI